MHESQGQPRAALRPATPAALCTVLVHGAGDIAAVLDLARGRPVALLSAPGVAGNLGIAGFRAMLPPDAMTLAILDAADSPGHALAALRAGFKHVVLAPDVPGFDAVALLAGCTEARVLAAPPPALDLARVDTAKAAGRLHLARWLDLP